MRITRACSIALMLGALLPPGVPDPAAATGGEGSRCDHAQLPATGPVTPVHAGAAGARWPYGAATEGSRVCLGETAAVELPSGDAPAPQGDSDRCRESVERDHGYDPGKAIADLTRAIRDDPQNPTTRYRRGCAYMRSGDIKGAIADFTEVIRERPRFVGAYLERAAAYARSGEVENAIGDYNAIILDPAVVWVGRIAARARLGRGAAYLRKGDLDKGVSDISVALEIDPSNAAGLCLRGWAHHQLGNYDEAIADCTEAIRLDPRSADAYANRGFAYSRKDRYGEAVADYTAAIGLSVTAATSARLLRLRGDAYARSGNKSAAAQDLAEANRLARKRGASGIGSIGNK